MQISDAADLAHTRPAPMHWLATATAMAGVVAVAGLLQPGPATASQAAHQGQGQVRAQSAPNHQALPAPDPAAAHFPLECGAAGTVVTKKASGDLDGDGSPETVAVVRCDSGSGTPPSGVYVLTKGTAATPRIVATLLDPKAKQSVGTGFAITGGAVLATLLGYSDPSVPSCCPDIQERVSWKWRGGAFVRSEQPTAKSV
ncbi:hypothetical protein HY68_21855 [Streptomyces sp. AcH 505]|uniref:hypothetical protein n=1 Tax=Streptomyces sp. NBC_00370 TaxID=2975728 RepID=UPI000591D469|nr:hypothetical protein HY68_21855 [Streptomyces sp. AcH 505]